MLTAEARDNLRVVLVETRNPLNIGAAARAMTNFGFDRLRVVKPYDVAWREARSAVGAAPLLARAEEFDTLESAIADCRLVVGTTSANAREVQHPLRRLEAAGQALAGELCAAPVALLFGSEKYGLSNEDLSYCHWLLRIGTASDDLSMNLGQAVAVCLYELVRDPEEAAWVPRARKRASGEREEILTEQLWSVMNESGYVNPVVAESTRQKARRMVRRLNLTERDSVVVLGLLRQVLWALRKTSK